MRIVAVTACPAGIAQTCVAAARLENIAKNLGHQTRWVRRVHDSEARFVRSGFPRRSHPK